MMLFRNIFIFHILFFCISGVAFTQVNPDSTHVQGVYKKIEDYSTKRKLTSLIHDLILAPATTHSSSPAVISGYRNHEPYIRYEGKIIRNINIVTLDPFGFSIQDTNANPRSFLEKSGNSLHLKTQHRIIRDRLLFKKGDCFDSLLVKESERLIRSQSYIYDVAVTAALISENSDSVDIFIRSSDLWSIIPDGALSNEHITIKLSDKNLAGLGHTFSNSYTQNYLNGDHAFSTSYLIPNIKNTYISTRLVYSVDENKNFQKSLNIDRPFFSPVARWAGGVFVAQEKQPVWLYKNDTSQLLPTSKYYIQDYWAAGAWQVFKGKSETDRTTKLIFSGRVFSMRYIEIPVEQPGIMGFYTSERFFMTGLGISSRKYVKQRYIFRSGTPEDVPIGIAYGIVVGYQLKNNERWFWGLKHSWGNFFKWGYFGTHIEFGTFINASERTEGVLTASMNYFSGLFTIGNWKFRQFVKPELTIGINRTTYERLNLNDGYGLNGFNSDVLSGTRRFLLVLQTQSYAPWNLLGFRFGPYLNVSFGMLGNKASGFSHSKLYPQLGMGVLIRNDYLIIRYFQLSFAFYPSIPGKGDNVFKANPFRSTDFGFQDFIIGKPEIVDFR